MQVFGTVPSRRLGCSLGINNIPPKICTYSCVYCQLGRTSTMTMERSTFYQPEDLQNQVEERVRASEECGQTIDYLTFVPDGEPTLDLNLGPLIEMLRPLGYKIAVITNASLLWQEGVREALKAADWVSLKVDAADEALWRRIDRPLRGLNHQKVVEGILRFAREYRGELVTETMLVGGMNDGEEALKGIASLLTRISPARSYLSVPIRPPAEPWVGPPSEEAVVSAFHLLGGAVEKIELLTAYEGNLFRPLGDMEEEILSITSVHPMREDAVRALLASASLGWDLVEQLLKEGLLREIEYQGRRFYLRGGFGLR